MRKLPTLIFTGLISISTALSANAIAANSNGSKNISRNISNNINKETFIKNYEKSGPIDACKKLKESQKSNKFILPGLTNNNQKCITLITPMVKKYLDKYSSAFPKIIHNNQVKTYTSEVMNAAGKEYIMQYMQIPKQQFLSQYTKGDTLEPLCKNLKKIPQSACLKNLKSIMKKCVTKVEPGIPNMLGYKDFQTVNKKIQPCFLKGYTPLTIFK